MTLTRRGKLTAVAGSAVVTLGTLLGVLALTGNTPAIIRQAITTVTGGEEEPLPACPLTGRPAPHGVIPDRPVLAVKIENAPEARPQTGLQHADIVYEEPVEGGLTRFIVLFHCVDGGTVGPVRSARTTDADVLRQYDRPLLAYAGGASRVSKALEDARVLDLSYLEVPGPYWRDEGRAAPHNLYSTTKKLWGAGKGSKGGAPRPVFVYDREPGKAKRVRTVHLAFSWSSDVYWTWDTGKGRWLRSHGDEPHMLTEAGQVAAVNVVVQVVKVKAGDIIDAAGNASPEVTLIGNGKAYVFRDGRMIAGRWTRDSLEDATTFVSRSGEEISLMPGNTWVELYPSSLDVETSRK